MPERTCFNLEVLPRFTASLPAQGHYHARFKPQMTPGWRGSWRCVKPGPSMAWELLLTCPKCGDEFEFLAAVGANGVLAGPVTCSDSACNFQEYGVLLRK